MYREGPVRNAILDWKLQGRDASLLWLLDTAEARLQELFSSQSLLLPIPMPLSRMRRAGCHHAADLCRAITRRTGASFDWQLLRRNGAQQRQSALNGRARWKNLCNAFYADNDHWAEIIASPVRKNVSNIQVWVVDDIVTTGATMHYACRALQRAGIQASAFSLTRLAHK